MKAKRLVLLLVLALVVVFFWRSRGAPPGTPLFTPLERDLARERAAAHFERGVLAEARAELAPLLAGPAPELDDLARAAAVDYMDREQVDPAPALARLAARDPDHPALHYMHARMALEAGQFERALEHFRAVLRRAPGDLAARVGLGATLADLERTDEARACFAEVVAGGVEHGGSWYVQALYRLGQLLARSGPPAEAQRLIALFQQLTDLGYRSASPPELDRGTLVGVRAPRPRGVEGAEPGRMPRFVAEAAILPELAGARELFALDLDHDEDVDFLAAGPNGVQWARRGPDGYAVETVLAGPAEHVRAFDLGNADALDLFVARGPSSTDGSSELVLLEQRSGAERLLGGPGGGRWSPSPLEFAAFPAPIADLALVDFDHDGDLDLLLAGGFGARLLRNDGAAPRTDAEGVTRRGAFVDVSAEASLPGGVELAWCLTEDFDGDQDVDLLVGGPSALYLMDSLRGGRFADVAPRVLVGLDGLARAPVVADFDGDARPDLVTLGREARLWRQQADGTFVPEPAGLALREDAAPLALDLDLDGTLDLFGASTTVAVEGVLGFGLDVARPERIEGRAQSGMPFVFADLERDLDLDLVRVTDAGLEILRCEGPVGRAARLDPRGLKDNRRAVGAVVEVRTRGLYRRIWWRGEPELVGCGPHVALDVVRLTWPNGAVQTRLAVAAKDQPFLDTPLGPLRQIDSLIGSCPFLYAWNGSTYVFVSDVLGGTPLGLPIGPGADGAGHRLVPPDHDEYVLVRGEELVPRDGRLELQLTEELREVTYLDRARLDVVDHPAEVEVYPNERFTFPPFPAAHLHTVASPLAPRRAVGSDGRDWASELAARDDVHALPFTPLEPQFLGLATPHWLELEFEPERVRAAQRLRLVCTGWFFWTDASVNMASARTPGVAFVPPTLELPDAGGAWRAVGPPLGFPAGKSKTMVIELDESVRAALDPERPRLRLASTLRLYWDSIQLAVDGDDAARRVTPLEPLSAELWPRGFSLPLPATRPDQPERFDWDALAPHQRWDPHPGDYTRFGETRALLTAVDDRFVILGTGDALALAFDARSLPPLPAGWRRDYMLFLDGWAKDRDPNTLEALRVEPLPFHGMSGYPYGPDERFPDGPEHRAWRAEWNTRRALPWIPPLAPRREAEWVRGLLGGSPGREYPLHVGRAVGER